MTDNLRGLAVDYYNRTWELIDQIDRTPADDRQMLTFAMTSRALTGNADLSLDFASAAFERAAQVDIPLWLRASTCEGLARAHAAAGHAAERDAWVARAKELLEQVDDRQDRGVIERQLATVDQV